MGAKPQKIEKVKELTARFRSASGAMFADFRGLTVKDAMEVRRALRASDTSLLVTKNTLTRLAVKEAGVDEAVLELLEGPTAVAFIEGDPIAGAKALVDSTRRFPALVVKGAVVEGRVLAQEQAQALATLDSKEVSVAKVAGILQAPLQRLAFLLQAPLQRIAFALAERGRQEAPAAGPAPGPEPAEGATEGPPQSDAAEGGPEAPLQEEVPAEAAEAATEPASEATEPPNSEESPDAASEKREDQPGQA
jgi:large subunit ribosomal protein L10